MKTKRRERRESDLPVGLAKPAQRALAAAGYWRLEQLANLGEAELKQLHGIGPKALDELRRAMSAKGLSFPAEQKRQSVMTSKRVNTTQEVDELDVMSAPARNIDDYLAALPDDARITLEILRKAIKIAAPKAAEVISYQIPTYTYHGHLVGFAASKNHCTFHIMSTAVLRAHAAELKHYDLNKASIRFPADKPPPAALVKRLVKARIAENEARAKHKSESKVANDTEKVNEFMRKLRHPFKAEVQAVREIILNVNKHITEEIKWNAPSFSYKGYMATFNLWAKEHVHLIFHNGAILHDKSGLLQGDYPDRRMVYFSSMEDVNSKRAVLEKAVKEWVKVMNRMHQLD